MSGKSEPVQTIERLIPQLAKTVQHRVWVISDLQQTDPKQARRCLTVAIQDYERLGLKCDAIWYLGDAVEGANLRALRRMTAMQFDLLGRLGVPVRYVMGNHEFDYAIHHKRGGPVIVPFWESAKTMPGWKTTRRLDDFYMIDQIGDWTVVFFSDHADPAGAWVSVHGDVYGKNPQDYPHTTDVYQALSHHIATLGERVITAGHYAFAGGNRPSTLLDRMLPVPENVKLHLYGHAHIGDAKWAKEHCFRKIAGIHGHKAPQIDVASLEDQRGSEIRSVMLELYEDHSIGVLFRDHSRVAWAEVYVLSDIR